MSTDYVFSRVLPEAEVLRAALAAGMSIVRRDGDVGLELDGNHVWLSPEPKRRVGGATRYGVNSAQEILDVLSDALDFSYYSEHEDDYFEILEEREREDEARSRKNQARAKKAKKAVR